MDPTNVQTILEWRTPQSVRDVQCFLGFANLSQIHQELLKEGFASYTINT